MNVIFDTDMLGDDLFALYAMMSDERIRLTGITTFGRITSALGRARMAEAFLKERGSYRIDIVPGADSPMLQPPRKGCMYCNQELCSLLDKWCYEGDSWIKSLSAAQYIVDKTREEKCTILATGPLTNIALALLLDSSLKERIEGVFLMGGVHTIPGNSSPVAEANIFNDADAASIVFRTLSGIHIIPYDLTMQVTLSEEETMAMEDPFLRSVGLSCCRSHKDRGGRSEIPLHDYLAYLAMVDDSVIGYEEHCIDIDNGKGPARGMMILRGNGEGKSFYGVSVNREKARSMATSDLRISLC